ncbi:MAG: glycosyltransferase family 2 protein [Nitrospirota bacterium]
MVALSIILPVYNEEDNIAELHSKITNALINLGKSYEIIYVDDGSQDRSFEILAEIAKVDERTKVIQFRKNFGQTAAIAAGFDHAQGEILIPMDADLQNDPEDIPKFLHKIEEGYDVVSGWRKNRKDKWITRRIPSVLANKLISLVTGVKLHDYGCTLKAYRKEVIENIKLYGEMHRFIPVYASLAGGKITEVVVTHHPRRHGKTKYGLSRTMKVILDLFTVKFFCSYATKPIYAFGGFGALLGLVGVMVGAVTIFQKYAYGIWVHKNPLLLLAVFLGILGIQLIMMGLLAEIIMRTYYESQAKPVYLVKKLINTGRG